MGSPVVSDDFPPLSSTADVCTRLSQLLTLWTRFGSFLGWLLNSDGNLSDAVLEGISDRTLPVGAVIMYGSHTPPSNKWMTCTGQAISRTTYSDLFSRIGTTYGVGDNSTTFNLPDFRDRVPIGSGSAYNPNAQGGAASVALNLKHFHGIGKTHANQNANFPVRNWSLADPGSTSSTTISGDGVENDGAAQLTSGDLATTTEITDLSAVNVATLPPYRGIPFMIKVL